MHCSMAILWLSRLAVYQDRGTGMIHGMILHFMVIPFSKHFTMFKSWASEDAGVAVTVSHGFMYAAVFGLHFSQVRCFCRQQSQRMALVHRH